MAVFATKICMKFVCTENLVIARFCSKVEIFWHIYVRTDIIITKKICCHIDLSRSVVEQLQSGSGVF